MANTPHLGLPEIEQGAAGLVPHNEALRALDALVHLAVLDRDLTAPPGSPAEGDRYIVKATATGAWAGQENKVAVLVDGAWVFHQPKAGWVAFVVDENTLLRWSGSSWVDYFSGVALQNLSLLGVNTTADATNKLAVKSSAVLFDHVGAGSQVKVNKAAAGDTASHLFQTGYSGRAEFGLTGDDNFHLKVSPDGVDWTEALVVDKTSGKFTLGGAVQVPAGSVSAPSLAVGEANTGLYRPSAGQLSVAVAGAQRLLFTSTDTRFDITGGGANTFYVRGEGSTALHVRRYSTDANAPITALHKARGTINTPADVVTSDTLGDIYWYGYGGGGFRSSCRIYGRVTAATPSATDMEGRLVILLAPPASVTPTEMARLDYDTGLSMYGANVVVDAARHHQLRSYTVATLPSAATAGQMIYISNESGGATPAFSDGTNWRRVSDRAIVS